MIAPLSGSHAASLFPLNGGKSTGMCTANTRPPMPQITSNIGQAVSRDALAPAPAGAQGDISARLASRIESLEKKASAKPDTASPASKAPKAGESAKQKNDDGKKGAEMLEKFFAALGDFAMKGAGMLGNALGSVAKLATTFATKLLGAFAK